LVKKLVKQGGVGVAINLGLTPQMLFNEGKDGLFFLNEHFRKYGVIPDWATLIEAVPQMANVDDEGLNESLEFLVDKAMWRFRGNLIQGGLKTATQLLGQSKPDDAMKVLSEAIARAEEANREKFASTVEMTSKKDVDEAWADYQHRKLLAGQPDGLPTPWPSITNATMGIHPGELWFIVARLKTGKT
jgi:replicative DNA helicase